MSEISSNMLLQHAWVVITKQSHKASLPLKQLLDALGPRNLLHW